MCNVAVKKKTIPKIVSDKLVYVLRRKFRVCFPRDHLRKGGPTIVFFAAFFMFAFSFSQNVFAGFDAYGGGLFRSYPLSGVLEGEAGYGILLRGTANDPFSSYMRAKLYGSSAVIYNSLDAAVELFPIAIAGIRAGGEAIQNDTKYSAYDCRANKCVGRFYRTYIEGELNLGAGPVFAQGRWRRERWTQKEPAAGDFIDATSAIAIKSEGDSQTVYFGIVGLNLNPKWSVLGIVRYAESDQLEGWSRFPYGVVRYKDGPLTVGLGAGMFESSLKKESFSALATLRWDFAPSLAVR